MKHARLGMRWCLVVATIFVGLWFSSCSERDDAGVGKTVGILSVVDTLGLATPDGALVLGEGAWIKERDKSGLGWRWDGGELEVVPGTGNLRTREKFGDCRIHVEFKVPEGMQGEWKLDGNSGVYIQRRYEVQILNSHGRETSDESCGAIYTQRAPAVNASRPVGEWQSYDLVFRAARWNGEKRIEQARLTAIHNGKLIHDDVAIPSQTGAGKPEGNSEEPLRLQDHGSAVRFRNVWIERLDLD